MHHSTRLPIIFLLIPLLVPSVLLGSGFPGLLPKFPVGPTPAGVAVGDFNGDGKLDLVLVNQSGSNSIVTVVFGKANGSFRTPISTTLSVPAAAAGPVFVGDFNGDHKLDIAFSGCNGFCVSLGQGDGTFGFAQGYPGGGAPIGIGDLNRDGKLDVVTGVDLFLGNGDGTFQTPPLSFADGACTLADVDGDGNPDLIGDTVQLSNGDGTFQAPIPLPIPGNGICPAVADFNGDGKLDLANSAIHGVAILFGNGDGTFQTPVNYHLGQDLLDFAVGDFNGDGKPDLFVNGGLLTASILLNTGKGRFPAVANYQFSYFTDFVLADFNGDGRTDVVAVGFHADFAEIAVASPAGSLALPRAYFTHGVAASVATGDFNGDGHVDLAVCLSPVGKPRAGVVNILAGKGDGTFGTPRASLTGGHGCDFVTAADLNHDGKLDLVFGSGDGITIRLGLGNGKFQEGVNYPANGVTEIAVADFDGDGIPDLAANSSNFILLGNGDGTFRTGTRLPTDIGSLVAADFNGDGKQDLAISLRLGGVGIIFGNGDGTFQPVSVLRKGQGGSLIVADFNRDGNIDLAGVGGTPSAAVASVYLGNGDGTLQPAKNTWIHGGVSPGGATTADFDGDGKADLAVTLSSGTVAVLRGNGTGGFQLPSFHPGGFSAGIPVIADFDGNGTPDLVFPNFFETTVTVLLNQP